CACQQDRVGSAVPGRIEAIAGGLTAYAQGRAWLRPGKEPASEAAVLGCCNVQFQEAVRGKIIGNGIAPGDSFRIHEVEVLSGTTVQRHPGFHWCKTQAQYPGIQYVESLYGSSDGKVFDT